MSDRTLVVAVVATVALVAIGPVTTAAVATLPVADAPSVQEDGDSAPMGASISSFMQASAADAEGEVDDGIFRARAANASNETRRVLVTQRMGSLEARLETLRERRQALLAQDGELTAEERAKAARLAVEIRSLRTAVTSVSEVARAAGINGTLLDRLSQGAAELSGPEVAEMAGGMADPPRNKTRGPPSDRDSDTETDAPADGNERDPDDAAPPGNDDRGDDERANDDRGNDDRGDDKRANDETATPTPTESE